MGAMASQITSFTIVCSTVYSSKKTSKLRVTGLCAGNSPVTGEFPAQMASDAENVSIWWRHHDTNGWNNNFGAKQTTDHYINQWWHSILTPIHLCMRHSVSMRWCVGGRSDRCHHIPLFAIFDCKFNVNITKKYCFISSWLSCSRSTYIMHFHNSMFHGYYWFITAYQGKSQHILSLGDDENIRQWNWLKWFSVPSHNLYQCWFIVISLNLISQSKRFSSRECVQNVVC